MLRRHFATATIGVLITSTAGCSSLSPDETTEDNADSDGPADVVEQFLQADDRESANALIHPDSPTGGYSEEEWKDLQSSNPGLEEILSVEIDGEQAVVEYEWTYGPDEERITDQEPIELRTHDGNWRIYDQDDCKLKHTRAKLARHALILFREELFRSLQ